MAQTTKAKAKPREGASEYRQAQERRGLATEEEIAAGRARVLEAVASGPPLVIESAFEVQDIHVHSCTIEGEEIRCMVVFSGKVRRPEATAVAKGVTQEIRIPAKVERHGGEV